MKKQQAEELEYDPELANHITNDPNVWGLLDIAVGRRPMVPTTIYKTSGDSASGVVGLLYPDGEFRSILPSGVGRNELRLQDGGADDGQMIPSERVLPVLAPGARPINAALSTAFSVVTSWDGAKREAPVEVLDPDTGLTSVRQGRSRGLLLGDYAVRGPRAKAEAPRQPNAWGGHANQTVRRTAVTRERLREAA